MENEEISSTEYNELLDEEIDRLHERLGTSKVDTNEEVDESALQEEFIVDGDDIRNHPQYEELRLDIPWGEDEEKGLMTNLDIYDSKTIPTRWQDKLNPFFDRNRPDGELDGKFLSYDIWRKRRHALTKGGDIPLEVRNFIFKGGTRLVSSILTAPERYYDMTRGDMYNEKGVMMSRSTGKKYVPDWNPLPREKDPWINSWWGGLGSTVTKYGVGGSLAMRAGAPNALVAEGAVALVSDFSQGDNVTGQLVKRVPQMKWILGGIATNDDDSPLVLTFKNTVEEMGLGKLIDHLFLKWGGDKGAAIVKRNNDNIVEQIVEKGKKELAEELEYDAAFRTPEALPTSAIVKQGDVIDVDVIPDPLEITGQTTKDLPTSGTVKSRIPKPNQIKSGMRGHKNKPLAQPGQGSPASNQPKGSFFNIYKQLNRIDDAGPTSNGSTGDVLTPTQAERGAQISGETVNYLKKRAKELWGEAEFKEFVKELRRTNVSFREAFQPAFDRMQEVMNRWDGGVPSDEFWEPILRDLPAQTGDGPWNPSQAHWSMENVLVADMVNGAIFKKLRNLGIAGAELNPLVDVFAPDSIMKNLEDHLIFGLKEVKRARYYAGAEFQKLKGPARAAAATKRAKEIDQETVDGVRLMMQMLKESESDELAQGILEVFSMSNKISNWTDFDAWMRQKIRGGMFGDKAQTGALMEELETLLINSLLSSPKTPLRAAIGTTANAFQNSINTFLGAAVRAPITGDFRMLGSSARNLKGMLELIPEGFKVFKTSLKVNWSKPLADIKTRYSNYKPDSWDIKQKWIDERANKHRVYQYEDLTNPEAIRASADVAAFNIANIARKLNNATLTGWSPRVLASIDDTAKHLMTRARSKELAFRDAWDAVTDNGTKYANITPELLDAAENMHFSRMFDEFGDLDISKDSYLMNQFQQATLTEPLTGASAYLEELFRKIPQIRPFFLFARTGVNGLKMNLRNMPGIAVLHAEFWRVLTANPKNLANLADLGISTADDLTQAKNLIIGRQIFGTGVVAVAYQKYLAGELTGNGPQDRSQRDLWSKTGWFRKRVTIGGVQIDYSAFEPYDLLLSIIADIGDNAELMGPKWVDERGRMLALAIAGNITSKSYLQGLADLVDLLSAKPGASTGRIIANIANGIFPFSALRNDIGKTLNPAMRELHKGILDSIRARNLYLESLTNKPLPKKMDLLNGNPIREWNFFERVYNAISPIGLNLVASPGRELLWNSNYDINLSVYSATDPKFGSINLKDSPVVRSLFAEAIGKYKNHKGQNLEDILNEYADPSIWPHIAESVKKMQRDIKNGDFHLDPKKAYAHNDMIHAAFSKAKEKAWASIRNHPEVIRLLEKKEQQLIDDRTSRKETSLSSYNKKKEKINKILERKNK